MLIMCYIAGIVTSVFTINACFIHFIASWSEENVQVCVICIVGIEIYTMFMERYLLEWNYKMLFQPRYKGLNVNSSVLHPKLTSNLDPKTNVWASWATLWSKSLHIWNLSWSGSLLQESIWGNGPSWITFIRQKELVRGLL